MDLNEKHSFTEYNVTVPTTDFAFGFEYVEDVDAVHVTVDGVDALEAGYSLRLKNSSTMEIQPPVQLGVVRIFRETDIDENLYVFTAGALFEARTMDENFKQIRHAQQEVRDMFVKLRTDTFITIERNNEENMKEIKQYVDGVFGMTNPNIFDGISDNMVITEDGNSQRYLNRKLIAKDAVQDLAIEGLKESVAGGSESAKAYTDKESERAKAAEAALGVRIRNERDRAKAAEDNLQLQINTTASGIRYFSTVAELNAYVPAGSEPKQAYVFATQMNYLYVNGAWKSEGISALDQSRTYTDNQVQSIFQRGVNIFDNRDIIEGKYWSAEYGVLSDAAPTFGASKLIPVEGGVELQTIAGYNQQFCYFDANRNFISGVTSVVDSDYKFTPPINCRYIGFTLDLLWRDYMMVCEPANFTPDFTPFMVKKEDLVVHSDQVIDLDLGVADSIGLSTVNIIDPLNRVDGYYIDFTNGKLAASPPTELYCVAGYYPIKGGTEYTTSAFYDQQFCFYDNERKFIGGLERPINRKFTTPKAAKYIRMSVLVKDLGRFMVAESSKSPAVYTPRQVTIKDLSIPNTQVIGLVDKIKEVAHLNDLNIVDLDGATEGHYISWDRGEMGAVAGFWATKFLPIKGGVDYRVDAKHDQQHAYYDADYKYISGVATVPVNQPFTAPANAKYVRFSVRNTELDTFMCTEASVFPSQYYPFKVKVLKDVIFPNTEKRVTDIWVSADVNDKDPKVKFRGNNAIQLALDSITDATALNRYVIWVKQGLYKVVKATDFIGYRGYPSMILMKDHVDVIGQGTGNTIIWAELPYNDADVGASIDGNVYDRGVYQTVYSYATDSVMADLTLVAKNIRYTIHMDDGRGADKTRVFRNVVCKFLGDKGSLQTYGCGTTSGEAVHVIGGRSESDRLFPFACHNNIALAKPSEYTFTGHSFACNDSRNNVAIYLQNDGSLVKDKFNITGCSFNGTAYVLDYVQVWLTCNNGNDSFNHAEWEVSGHSNEPFLFRNSVKGECLRFRSTAKGAGTIRFNTDSSAFNVLIRNHHINSDGRLYTNNQEYIDGYIVQDGSAGLSAIAYGNKDLGEVAAMYDGGVVYTSLAKRLGNCVTSPKALGVLVNNTPVIVNFTKDYTGSTNSAILADINAQLGGLAVADLYNYGRDYYPHMPDVMEVAYNTGSTFIPKGSVVTKVGGSVRVANGTDKVFGVALDDIPVRYTSTEGVKRGEGRVLKRGYISTDRSAAHFVLADSTTAIGSRFNVVNGSLVANAAGVIQINIDTGVVSINC